MPWRLSADLKRFRVLTMGHHVIVGRKTYESIGRPLPGREMIVVTRARAFTAAGARIAHDPEQALALCAGDAEVFVIGGADIYRLFLPRADRLYLTEVKAALAGDTYFPPFDKAAWREVERESHRANANNDHDYDFVVYERHAASRN